MLQQAILSRARLNCDSEKTRLNPCLKLPLGHEWTIGIG
jgi:hypothetical protein